MEAASAASGISGRLRAHRLERELERLRPLGEAYLLRRFAGRIGHADAEDAVAEAVARLHRAIVGGTVPESLRAMFFASAHNAALDILRAHRRRPTAPLEAADGAAGDPESRPPEWAESREASVRLQEMLARMRAKHGEALMLHYGLGMTVPQVADHLGISRPAAKKRMLRAVREARERMAEIEGAEVCPQMRSLAWRSMFDKQASGLATEAEAEALRAHFAHCGACRSFLATLRDALHELGGAALAGLSAGEGVGAHDGIAAQLGQWAGGAAHGLEAGVEKARQLALRAAGPLSPGEGAAGALLGTGQKVAAICGAAGAATATCLLTGAVGPGLGASAAPSQAEQPTPQVRPAAAPAPPSQPAPEPTQSAPEQRAPEPAPAPEPRPEQTPSTVEEATPAPATPAAPPPEPPPSEFGLEGGRSGSAASEPAAPSAPEAGGEFGGGATGGARPGGSGASPGVGFQG